MSADKAKCSDGMGTSKEDQEEEYYPQSIEDAQWVTATTQFGWSSRKPEQYQQQLNAEDITGLASKNYCALLYEEKMMMKKGLGDCFENTLAL